jgi:hypothetical protein
MILYVLTLVVVLRSLLMRLEGRRLQGDIDSVRNVDHVTEN